MVHTADLRKFASTRVQSRVLACFSERRCLAVVAWNEGALGAPSLQALAGGSSPRKKARIKPNNQKIKIMKTMRPVAVGGAVLVLTAGIFFSSTFHSPAQFKLQADVAPIEPEQEQPVSDKPDTVVRIVAESKGLPEIQQSELPRYGTYWEALSTFGQIMAPMPWLPTDARVIYQMADGQFLVDNGQTCQIPQPIKHGKLQAPTPAEFLQSQVDKLVGLIAQVQSAPKQTALDTKSPGALKRAGVMSRTSLRMASASASSVPTPGVAGDLAPRNRHRVLTPGGTTRNSRIRCLRWLTRTKPL